MVEIRSGSIRIDIDLFSGVYCYHNDVQIKSENAGGIYSFAYKDIELKKGDKLKLHYFSVNSLHASVYEKEIQLIFINGINIKEFDHSTASPKN